MDLKRREDKARIAARAAAALALDMGRQGPVAVEAPPAEDVLTVAGALAGESAVVDNGGTPGEQVPAEAPPEVEAPEQSLLLAGGYFRLRELYKPGTGKFKEEPVRSLRSAKR